MKEGWTQARHLNLFPELLRMIWGKMASEIRSDVHKHIPAEAKVTLETLLPSQTERSCLTKGNQACSAKGGIQLLLTPVQLWGDFSSLVAILSPVAHITCDLPSATRKGSSRDASDHPTKSRPLVFSP